MSSECLLYSYLLDGNGGARELAENELGDVNAKHGIVWSHIEYGQVNTMKWLTAQGVDSVVADLLTEPETRPRLLTYNSGVLLMLRGVNMNPGADVEDMVAVRIWIDGNRIITARQRRLMSVEEIRQALLAEKGPKTAAEFMVTLTERIADRIGHVVNLIEEEIDQCEEDSDTAELAMLRARLSSSRRKTASIRRFLGPQREALNSVHRIPTSLLLETDSHNLREQADRVTRYIEDLDLVRERTMVLQEELYNRIAQEQNSRMYLLSIVATIFLPLSFLTGVFGMNVAGLPGVENAMGFMWVAGSMSVIGLGIVGLMWKKRWF